MSREIIFTDTRGVSVIVGAMMLIIIVVVGAVAVAAIVSSLQEQAAEKASYKAAVEREELDITKISLYEAATIDDFEGVYKIISHTAEIGYRVRITDIKDDPDRYGWDSIGCTLEMAKQRAGTPGKYSLKVTGSSGSSITRTFKPFFHNGEELELSFWVNSLDDITVLLSKDGSAPVVTETISSTGGNWEEKKVKSTEEFNEIEFELSSSKPVYLDDIKYIHPCYWGEIELTIRNLNIDKSTLREIAINKHFAHNYSLFTLRKGKEVFTPKYPYDIPAHSTAPVRMNFLTDFGSPVHIRTTESIETLLITSLGNNFADAFAPPVPVADVEVVTENLGIAYRDVLILDASGSYDPDGFVREYKWLIYNDSGGEITIRTGKKIRLAPCDFNYNRTGPFKIDLEVADDTGMSARLSRQSGNISIPANMNFNPPVRLEAKKLDGNEIGAWVTDTKGDGVKGVVVNFLRYSSYENVTAVPSSCVTNADGFTSTTITGNGTIRVECGKLPYVNVKVG
jgi:hypothetical protein